MNDTPNHEGLREQKSGCAGSCLGAIFGVVLGALAAIAWIYFNPPAITPEHLNSDGLNRDGGQMGLITLGILFGGIIGGCVGANKK